MNHWNRCTPITLAGYQPIAQFITDRFLPGPFFFQPVNHFSQSGIFSSFLFSDLCSIKLVTVDHGTRSYICFRHLLTIELLPIRLNHRDNFQSKLPGKIKIPLIMGRNRHDCTVSITHHHIICDPDRNPGLIDRIYRITSCKYT